jgi:hypothetical protein
MEGAFVTQGLLERELAYMIPHLRLHCAVASRGLFPSVYEGTTGSQRLLRTTLVAQQTRQRQCSYAIAGTARWDRDHVGDNAAALSLDRLMGVGSGCEEVWKYGAQIIHSS